VVFSRGVDFFLFLGFPDSQVSGGLFNEGVAMPGAAFNPPNYTWLDEYPVHAPFDAGGRAVFWRVVTGGLVLSGLCRWFGLENPFFVDRFPVASFLLLRIASGGLSGLRGARGKFFHRKARFSRACLPPF